MKKRMNKKLALNRSTIASLDNEAMKKNWAGNLAVSEEGWGACETLGATNCGMACEPATMNYCTGNGYQWTELPLCNLATEPLWSLVPYLC